MERNLSTQIILAILFISIFFKYSSGQSGKHIILKGSVTPGLSKPLNDPVHFPEGFICAYYVPSNQSPKLGFQLSLAGLYSFDNRFSLGLNGFVSDHTFVESGTIEGNGGMSLYSIKRAFKMYGGGIQIGYCLINMEKGKLSTYLGFNYAEFISTENVYLWSEDYNKNKYQSSISLEYGHTITENLFLTCGISSSIGLVDFYETIAYRPITYGVSAGIEYVLNIK